jgi:putative addiction module component (TIGR02574 family)
MNIDNIASEALRLSPYDRAVLAETIWESLEDPYLIPCELSDNEAIVLARKRDEEIEQGNVKPLSHQELMKRLRG